MRKKPKLEENKVICPNCCHQFRAIPEDVQRLVVDQNEKLTRFEGMADAIILCKQLTKP